MSIDINMREKKLQRCSTSLYKWAPEATFECNRKKAEENFEFVTKYLASSGDQESKWMIETANNLEQ